MGQRVDLKELRHTQSDGDNHKGKSQNNPGGMGRCTPRAKLGSSGHKHQIVGPGRDRGNKTKEHETGQQRICHGSQMSPLPAKFNAPSSRILPKKNGDIREEDTADFYRLQGGESLWFRSKAVGGGSVKLNSGLFAECGLVSDALDRGPMNAKIGQLAAC